MATRYTDVTTGNNLVSSAAGYALTSATNTVTKTSAFANYVYHAGDQFEVEDTGTGGHAVIGYYTIASRVGDNSITLTTDPTDGTDETNVTCEFGNNGTTETTSAGTHNGPWKDLGYAANQVSAGDHVYVKASGTYSYQDPDFVGGGSDTAVMEFSTVGTSSDSIRWEGYYSTPGDGGVITIDATGKTYGIIYAGSTYVYNMFMNIRITGASDAGFSCTGGMRATLIKVRADNCGAEGIDLGNYCTAIMCQGDNNTNLGIKVSSNGKIVLCVAFGNGDEGISASYFTSNCLVYENGTSSANASGLALKWVHGLALNCTVDGGGGSSRGIQYYYSNGYDMAYINNIVFNCADGLYMGSSELNVYADNNLFYSCTTNRTNVPAGDNDVVATSNPFVDSDSDDYRLAPTSEAKCAGVDAMWIKKYWESLAGGTNPPVVP